MKKTINNWGLYVPKHVILDIQRFESEDEEFEYVYSASLTFILDEKDDKFTEGITITLDVLDSCPSCLLDKLVPQLIHQYGGISSRVSVYDEEGEEIQTFDLDDYEHIQQNHLEKVEPSDISVTLH